MWRDHSSPGEAVSSSQDPLVVDQGASTEVAAAPVQTDLPGPGAGRSILTAHDPRVERCDATNWRETGRIHDSAAGR